MTLRIGARTALVALSLAFAAPAIPAFAQEPAPITAKTLIDRAQITELLANYYNEFGSPDRGNFGDHFTDDGVLDVNGKVATGKKDIQALYAGGGPARAGGKFHMLMSNLEIDVKGDTATAVLVWTGVMNDSLKAPPRFLEQGREYDELVKIKGRWLLTKRVVTADSALPDSYDATYVKR
jgi:ketosteroid isomerase-like protein